MSSPEGISEDLWKGVREARLWSDASDDALEWMARSARVRECARGDLLFRSGEIPKDVALILDGHARAVYGHDQRTISAETYWPGDVIGSIAALSGLGFEVDIEVVEPLAVALVPFGALKDLLRSEPGVAMSVIDDVTRRWVHALAMAKRGSLSVPHRIAGYLSELPRTRLGESSYSVEIPVARAELASLLGTTPETLCRSLRAMEEAELIEAHERLIIVLDGEALLG